MRLPPYFWEFHILLVVTVVITSIYTIWRKSIEKRKTPAKER